MVHWYWWWSHLLVIKLSKFFLHEKSDLFYFHGFIPLFFCYFTGIFLFFFYIENTKKGILEIKVWTAEEFQASLLSSWPCFFAMKNGRLHCKYLKVQLFTVSQISTVIPLERNFGNNGLDCWRIPGFFFVIMTLFFRKMVGDTANISEYNFSLCPNFQM